MKVGANGEIIIDESSTMVETTASKRARTDLANSTLVVENAGNKLTNYGTYSKKRKYSDWTEGETFRFYRYKVRYIMYNELRFSIDFLN